jgi:tol-pal system protein YbgF
MKHVFLVLFLLFAATAPAAAQVNDMRAILARIEQLQRQMDTVARQVYQGNPPPEAVSKPVLAGNTDVQNLAAATDDRLNALEASVREINNRLDTLDYTLGEFKKQLDLLKGDTDMRFKEIAPRADVKVQPFAGQAPEPTPEETAAHTQKLMENTVSPEVDTPAGKTAAPADDTDAGAVQNLPTDSATALYDAAFQLVRDRKYAAAEKAFTEFLKRFGSDALAGNAHYWLGETYYVRGNYTEAAKIFAVGYQYYPRSSKAPDNLLKLGLTLAQLGKVQDACVTFGQLTTQYKNAAEVIKQRAEKESKKLKCGAPNAE